MVARVPGGGGGWTGGVPATTIAMTTHTMIGRCRPHSWGGGGRRIHPPRNEPDHAQLRFNSYISHGAAQAPQEEGALLGRGIRNRGARCTCRIGQVELRRAGGGGGGVDASARTSSATLGRHRRWGTRSSCARCCGGALSLTTPACHTTLSSGPTLLRCHTTQWRSPGCSTH